MYNRSLFLIVAFAGILSLFPQHDAEASDFGRSVSSLKGLVALKVVVEQLDPKVEGNGITQKQLETDIELRLRQAGVNVSEQASALLYANVAVLCGDFACAYNISLDLQQAVRLVMRPDAGTMPAATWNSGITGLLKGHNLEPVRKTLKDQVDQFLNSYLAANPK